MTWSQTLLSNAVAKKDLLSLSRRWEPGLLVGTCVSVLGVVSVVSIATQVAENAYTPERLGTELFDALSLAQLSLLLAVSPALYAGLLGEERQRQTWDLLVLTRLSSFAIIWGKLVAGFAPNLLLVLAPLPLYAVAFLFGGVSVGTLISVYVVFAVTALFAASLGLLVGTLIRSFLPSILLSSALGVLAAAALSALLLEVGDGGQLAALDPYAALVSALPDGGGTVLVGGLARMQHPFGASAGMSLSSAYSLLYAALSLALLALAASLVRNVPGHGVARRIGRFS
jgi:ABC-type transport system involved in multi-copper enzyme maturation permease subunit